MAFKMKIEIFLASTFFLTAFALHGKAAPASPVYRVETILTRNGKLEKMNILVQANETASITTMDTKTNKGMTLEITPERVDEETVYLSYKVKEIIKGQEKLVASPQAMVFLDQNAQIETGGPDSKSDLGMQIKVTETK